MRLKPSSGVEQELGGTRQRVMECRRRLRRARATQRALRLEQDEAVVGARELLALVPGGSVADDAGEFFEGAGAAVPGTDRGLVPEVDRRTRLRAR